MREQYRWLNLVLVICAAAAATAAAVGLFLLSRTADFGTAAGQWLLTLAVAFTVTGALSLVVRQIDQRRSEREAWHAVLHDLVAANQKVEMARLRLLADRSAKTYQQQLGEFMGARVDIRRINAMHIVVEDISLLPEHVEMMKDYLDALGEEYETGYLRVARQQRLDELWLTDRMEAAKEDASVAPSLPEPLAGPTEAWRQLTDPARFPRLAALLDEPVFKIDTFRTRYKLAKNILERHAGFKDRSTNRSADAAQKLSERTKKFMEWLPDKDRAELEKLVGDLDVARDPPDLLKIDQATFALNKATAKAILDFYGAPPARRVAAATDEAAAVTDIDGHPASSPP